MRPLALLSGLTLAAILFRSAFVLGHSHFSQSWLAWAEATLSIVFSLALDGFPGDAARRGLFWRSEIPEKENILFKSIYVNMKFSFKNSIK